MDFVFRTATEIRFGRGKARGATADIAGFGVRFLIVHGASAARSDWLADALSAAGRDVLRFSCPFEPDLARVMEGCEVARAGQVDAVIGLGGGAAIDLAKAIAALVPATGDILDHLEVVGRGLPLAATPLPFIAIPTTSGTGAEVTRNAVIGVPEHRRKVSLRDPAMLADLAIVDPALTDGAPKSVTLASGLDAVTQVIEPYLSTRANPLTDALCRATIPSGLAALVRLMEQENQAARDALAWTSLAGGLALANSGLGAVHGLAGPIGGHAPEAPHGAVCGALLPHVLSANARHEAAPQHRMAEVLDWIGTALGCAAHDAPCALASWTKTQGLPTLGDMGVVQQDLTPIARASAASSSMRGNPAPLSEADLLAILEAAY